MRKAALPGLPIPAQDGNEESIVRAPLRMALFGAGLLGAAIYLILILLFCHYRLQSEKRVLFDAEWASQQENINSGLSRIAHWRYSMMARLSLVCESDMLHMLLRNEENMEQSAASNLHDAQEKEDPGEVVDNIAYVNALLQEFASRFKWEKVFLARSDGNMLAGEGRQWSEEQKDFALEVVQKGQILFGAVRKSAHGLVMDIAAPVFQIGIGRRPKISAVVLVTVLMDESLKLFLREQDNDSAGRPVIFQHYDGKSAAITVNFGEVELLPVSAPFAGKYLPFALRQSVFGAQKVYSLGSPLFNLPWTFILESPDARLNALVSAQKKAIYTQGFLLLVAGAGFFLFLWLRYFRRIIIFGNINHEHLTATIQRQKLLLDTLNSTFHSGLALVDSEGRILTCNEAFCRITGRESISPGISVRELMPGEAGKNLLAGMNISRDISQMESGSQPDFRTRNADMEIVLPPAPGAGGSEGKELYMGGCLYRVTLFPCLEADNLTPLGRGACVAIFQDITSHRNESQRQKRRQAALVSALSRAIESVDENLLGHSDRMASLAKKLTEPLDLQPDETETLELACHLSQIGRLFVPRELFTKTAPLSSHELELLHKMPEYASKLLNNLDFDLPVSKIISEMGERMDGSGFPAGLIGIQISRCARILAVLNAYVAMTSARVWRSSGKMSHEAALDLMACDDGFDQQIVKALRLVVASGKKHQNKCR